MISSCSILWWDFLSCPLSHNSNNSSIGSASFSFGEILSFSKIKSLLMSFVLFFDSLCDGRLSIYLDLSYPLASLRIAALWPSDTNPVSVSRIANFNLSCLYNSSYFFLNPSVINGLRGCCKGVNTGWSIWPSATKLT